jgi:hypothetical protein
LIASTPHTKIVPVDAEDRKRNFKTCWHTVSPEEQANFQIPSCLGLHPRISRTKFEAAGRREGRELNEYQTDQLAFLIHRRTLYSVLLIKFELRMWSNYFLLTTALVFSLSHAFVPMAASLRPFALTKLSSSTATDYDIVKVDLSDGRDYPIYIGAGFSDEEG